MSILTPSRAEAFFWMALCGGLLTAIGVETDWGTTWQKQLPLAPLDKASFTEPKLTEPFRLPPADEFLETAMRPLFVTTRRPAPAAPPPEPPKPAMKRNQFVLTGVTVLPEGKFAFLTEKAGNRSRVVAEGKEINGITVKEIRNDRVVLSQYDETETLILRTAKGPATTVVPPVDAAAVPGTPSAASPASAGAPGAAVGQPIGAEGAIEPPQTVPRTSRSRRSSAPSPASAPPQ